MFEMPPPQPPQLVAASDCEVVERPADFDGKMISVSGTFLTDWHHGSLIVGQPCGKGVWFGGDTALLGEPWTRIERTRRTTETIVITLTAVGRLHWTPEATGMFPATHVLDVEDITSLDIRPR